MTIGMTHKPTLVRQALSESIEGQIEYYSNNVWNRSIPTLWSPPIATRNDVPSIRICVTLSRHCGAYFGYNRNHYRVFGTKHNCIVAKTLIYRIHSIIGYNYIDDPHLVEIISNKLEGMTFSAYLKGMRGEKSDIVSRIVSMSDMARIEMYKDMISNRDNMSKPYIAEDIE